MPLGTVIPAYRSAATIAATLDALAAQTVAPAATIVVVDGPDPATEAAIRAHPSRIEVVVLPENTGGPGTPRNIGAEKLLARTPLDAIWFLDADDVPDPRFLEIASGLLDRHPDADLIATGFRRWSDGESMPSRDHEPGRGSETIDLDWYLDRTGSILPSFSLIRTSALVAVRDDGRPFDGTIRINQDYDLFVRLLHRGRGRRAVWSGGAYRMHLGGISADGPSLWTCRMTTNEGLARWFEVEGDAAAAARFRRAAGSALRTAARHLWRRSHPGDRATAARLLIDDVVSRRDPRSVSVLAGLIAGIDRRARSIARHGDARRSR